MRAKIAIFLSVLLFIVGCGVMNNPDNNKESVEDGGFDAAAKISLEVSKVGSDSLIGDMSISELDSYRIFETSAFEEQFLTDLNSTAQTLESGDLATVEGWIKSIDDANISYQENNFFFYPIFQDEDCGRKDSVMVEDKNATITLEATREQCDTAHVYHVLMYKVDKSIENILINAFGEATVTISNSAK